MRAADFDFILSRLRAKLNGWVANSLSMAGRVTLGKSVLAAIPAFFMQTIKFSASVCVEIDKIICGFIWGSSASARKIYLVNWSAIFQPRGHGGLGIPRSKERNLAFMHKLAFSLVSTPDAMWVTVLRQKYHMLSTCPHSISQPNCSPLWCALSNMWYIVRENIFWLVGNGNNVHLWNDTWVPTLGPLHPWASLNVSNIDNLRFVDLLLDDGQWNVCCLLNLMPHSAVPHIMGVMPPSFGGSRDTVAWKLTPTGSFSVASAYECMVDSA
ncbi:hypothetical protein V6N12_058313 [Hibiscus sabdariffa]|uniref:Reverse transcriptase zinc-binding domain-containing protein n=1 Tax=Hibiscus sabdariffa TaxID=183260 RepID=A0ABR2ERX1_9ROSI